MVNHYPKDGVVNYGQCLRELNGLDKICQRIIFLFTDADIKHSVDNLSQLLAKAEKDNLDLVSLMVKLHCQSFWEKLLIPAFIFSFKNSILFL